ncbi:TIGR03086 family metal-binding protein [Rhodococcus zopfii]|uniref:TIGR03086 family protein n=1 Tax=Rhodococcus zopfii TaxID=43772 RepID=A0ABU3WU81_9NOCA|nr:TIGR03086 family metal-binding protein [Rhodococcus zopfii]MDV2477553.1 TIGR03086 family protein [Rhodococcus zopfii]
MTNAVSPADHYRDLAAKFTATVDAVPTDRWSSPSPCDGWTARDLVQHVVDTQREIVTKVGLELPPGPSPEADPVGAWAATRDGVQEILDDPARGNLEYDGYFGRTSLAATVDTFYTFDLVVHGWDLARATGLDETIAAADLDFVESAAAGMGESIRMEGVCGPALEVPEGADRTTRVLAFLGRQA